MSTSQLHRGQRVTCYKDGYKGLNGRVVDKLAGGLVAKVDFDGSTVVARERYFEPVNPNYE